MSDVNSSLPVRTVTNADAVVGIADTTVPSQTLAVDASGRITTKMDDGAGNPVTSQANGGQRALDVGIDVAGVQIDPRQIRTLTATDVVSSHTEDGSGNPITSTASALDVNLKSSSITIPVSGTVTANQGTANTAANGWPVKPTDGTNSQSFTAAGEAKVTVTEPLPAGTNAIGTVNASNLPTTVDTNYGTVGASTIRTASQIGNATGAANFNNGATGAQTLRTAANLAVAGADVSSTNPVPVTLTSALTGTPVNKYNTTSALAAGGTANHDYTITAAKTFSGKLFFASGSGRIKIDVQTSPDGTTFTTFWTAFNSTANPNIAIELDQLVILDSGTGSKVRIVITNEELLLAQNVYSTISGTETP